MSEDAPPRTEDGRYIVVNSRRWRATDPSIPEAFRQELVNELMNARRAVKAGEPGARERVSDAKVALGERGAPWWDEPPDAEFARRAIATANALLRHREGKSICPSDVARSIGGVSWRSRMDAVRAAVAEEASAGRLRVTQKNETVDLAAAKGPVRIVAGQRFEHAPEPKRNG